MTRSPADGRASCHFGSAKGTARKKAGEPILPLVFAFPETMAKWAVMLDEFKFEVISHGGRTGIQMRILRDQGTMQAKKAPGRPSKAQIGASRAPVGRGRI